MLRALHNGLQLGFPLNGVDLVADLSGALYWPGADTLIVADLHLEKASSLARGGQPLPPYDTRVTLERLEAVVRRTRPKRVVCLGDSFHDTAGPGRLGGAERRGLDALASGREWVWITGNHDPGGHRGLPGEAVADLAEGGLILRHEAVAGGRAEVSGHYHPKARLRVRGSAIGGPCFVTDGNRLILPAFGALTGGLSVRSAPFPSLLARQFLVLLPGRTRIIAVPSSRLSG